MRSRSLCAPFYYEIQLMDGWISIAMPFFNARYAMPFAYNLPSFLLAVAKLMSSIDREFEFYEFFSFLKFNEFYEFFFG